MPALSKSEILQALRALTDTEKIELQELALADTPASTYAPVNEYILSVKMGTKPETASEGLFRALAKDVLGVTAFPQVNIGDGFVDFVLPEVDDSTVLLELKSLFTSYNESELRRYEVKAAIHLDQVKKYVSKNEFVILTDLRTAYLYSERHTNVDGTYFRSLPFAELMERQMETRSLRDALRRLEDEYEKPELDRQFFEDLGDWYRAFSATKFLEPSLADELVILLINKIIFAKTLEDFGLVNFRWIQDEYQKQKDRWEPKGAASVLRSFLNNFEEFFDEYYDTELFERKIWKQLDKSTENLERFARNLEFVLGIGKWNEAFRRGIVHYNYRQINEDIFGKSYEMFLAANRKGEGIYYTPAPITTPMANSLVESLFAPLVTEISALVAANKCDFAGADKLMAQLADIRIIDTAAGSGGFLIKVLRAVWQQYAKIEQACGWAGKISRDGLFDMPANVQQAIEFRRRHLFDDARRRELVATILLRHIFAIDKDAGAVEVAKTNIWKEAVKLTPPDYNFRALKGDVTKILPNLELNFICNDSLVDANLAEQLAWLSTTGRHAITQLHALRNQYIANPSDHTPLEEALTVRREIRADLIKHFATEKLPCDPLLIALSFFPAYFTPDGKALPAPELGFHGCLGNPPWEAVKPVRKEFAKQGKYGMDATDFDAWLEKKIKTDAEFAARWQTYVKGFETYKVYLDSHFKNQGTGDWNYFKLFLENNLNLLRQGGQLALLVPSGIQTDEGCGDLRRLFVTAHTLAELTSFENRGYTVQIEGKPKTVKIFPDVDNRYKFTMLKILKGAPPDASHTFDARFYLHDPASITAPPIHYSVEMMQRFSPTNFSIMEFRTEKDYALCTKIRAGHPLLQDLGYQFRREFHVTEDAHFFKKRGTHKMTTGDLSLHEGKMIFQFDTQYAPGTYYVVEKEIREELLHKEIFRIAQFVRESKAKFLDGKPVPPKKEDLEKVLRRIFTAKKFKLHYECERLAYRKIGSSTNERTLIGAVIKPRVCLAESMNYLTPVTYDIDQKGRLEQRAIPDGFAHEITALFNSLVLNYYIRNKISANVNLFYLYELPIPKLTGKLKERLAEAAERLSKQPRDTKERAKLEVLIAKDVYGLAKSDWQHLTGTFTYGGESDTKAELDDIIRRSLDLW